MVVCVIHFHSRVGSEENRTAARSLQLWFPLYGALDLFALLLQLLLPIRLNLIRHGRESFNITSGRRSFRYQPYSLSLSLLFNLPEDYFCSWKVSLCATSFPFTKRKYGRHHVTRRAAKIGQCKDDVRGFSATKCTV